MKPRDDEDRALRSVAMQNAQSILLARQRAEEQLVEATGALERKTGELARSLSVVRATLDSTWDGILVTDDSGRITAHNGIFIRMWKGRGDEVATGDHRAVLQAMATEFADAPRFVARVDEILAQAPAESFDVLNLRDGRMFERFSRRLLVDERAVGRLWSFRDITQRRNAEIALRDETRMLELLNQTGMIIAAELDLKVLLQSVIDAATELIGARYGVVALNTAGERGDTFVARAATGIVPAAFERLRAGAGRIAVRARCRRRAGDSVPRCARGRALGHVGHEPQFARTPSRAQLSGGTGEVAIGRGDRRTLLRPSGIRQCSRSAANGSFSGWRRRPPSPSTMRASTKPRSRPPRSARSCLTASERRVTTRKALSATKDEFLATLSHELRTPLTAILGWAHVLRHGSGSRDDLQKGLEVIERNARAQTQLIEDLLDMSRITSGKVRLDIQPVQPISFIEAAIETVRPAAEAKGIRLEKVLDPVGRPRLRRSRPPAAGHLESAVQRDQVHAQGRPVQVVLERVNSHRRNQRRRLWNRHRARFPAPTCSIAFARRMHSTTRELRRAGARARRSSSTSSSCMAGTVRATSPGEGLGATFTVNLPVTAVHVRPQGTARASGGEPAVPPDFQPLDLSGVKVLLVD